MGTGPLTIITPFRFTEIPSYKLYSRKGKKIESFERCDYFKIFLKKKMNIL